VVFILSIVVFLVIVAAVMGSVHMYLRMHAAERERAATEEKFAGVTDARAERERILRKLQDERLAVEHRQRASLTEIRESEARLKSLKEMLKSLTGEAVLAQVAFYKPQYDFGTSQAYQFRVDGVREAQAALVRSNQAISANGSLTGTDKREVRALAKLMMRAFNGESDAAIARVTYKNIDTMEARIQKAFETINAFGQTRSCRISKDYLRLRLQELHLVHEHQEKVQEEKEEQRAIRERMRDEEMARREIEKVKEKAEREERQFEAALRIAREEAAQAVGAKQDQLSAQIQELEAKLAEAHANRERAISRAQQTRSGHVYVISNIGSFGESVFKVGMTRRLEPMDRIWELGDASVPFDFDVHAIIYSDDAPSLENKLHHLLEERRVNRVNRRKECFRVTIDEIAEAVTKHHGVVEFMKEQEAKEWRQTQAILEGRTSEVDLDGAAAASRTLLADGDDETGLDESDLQRATQ